MQIDERFRSLDAPAEEEVGHLCLLLLLISVIVHPKL